MATDNQAVTAYLPPDLVESITKYCTKYHITHKDGRPKLGTGIVELLKAAFSGEAPSPVPGIVPSVVPSLEEIEDMIRGVVKDTLPSTLPDTLPNWDNKLETAIAAKLKPLQNDVSSFRQESDRIRQQLEELAEKIPPSPENAPSELPLEDAKLEGKDETTQSNDEPVTELISKEATTETHREEAKTVAQMPLPLDEKIEENNKADSEGGKTYAGAIALLQQWQEEEKTQSWMAKELERLGYPTKSGRGKWDGSKVSRILNPQPKKEDN